ncbi:MAG TPA: SDR family NAD(P)-dependent oxidoreductase, partial [Thermoanaerobaculia bacterium]
MAPATLITGASSGIGRELTKLFAEDRKDLVLVARNRKKLDEFARDLTAAFGVAVRVVAKDLARPDTPAEIAKELSSAGIAIDTLVNNAGFGVYGPFGETDGAQELE